MEVLKPYEDSGNIRTFSEDIDEEELIWHRDKEDRIITVIEGKNWKLQIDNQLPIEMESGEDYFIGNMVYHRLLKGEGKLILKINRMGKKNGNKTGR